MEPGPTLTAYLAREAPTVLAAFADADRRGGGTGMAQAFHHAILPLAALHDRKTEVLWGLRDFEYRFGRPATAMWLPETAVDLATLRVMAEAGVRAVVLAPWQAEVPHVDPRRPYRVDVGGGHHITAMFYDGDLSGAVSFEPGATADADRFARERVGPRLAPALPDGTDPTLVIATDGELYGHHQSFRDLFLQRLVAPEAGAYRSFDVVSLASVVAEHEDRPHPEMRIRERTSWSCHHGILRWSTECPDVPDGRWKGPLRAALERLAGGIDVATDALARDLPRLGRRLGRAEPLRGRRHRRAGRRRLRRRVPRGAVARRGPGDPPRAHGGPALAPRDVRVVRLVLGRPGTPGDPPGAACRGARRADRGPPRRIVARGAPRRRSRHLRSPSLGIDGDAIYRQALAGVGQPPPATPGRRARLARRGP